MLTLMSYDSFHDFPFPSFGIIFCYKINHLVLYFVKILLANLLNYKSDLLFVFFGYIELLYIFMEMGLYRSKNHRTRWG
ncbi:hypothetical protein HanIR_Chr11g0549971 [Helianthus annuus]|nr:hypothetical protein HanIR_Chr11g0549971 [Helianthus annuus]